jgi:two-component system chemotaxis response regulator CheB
VVAVGASAGGVEALRSLVGGLPPDYPAAVMVVLHVPRDAPSALSSILDRSGPLPAAVARDNEPLRRGRVYVAPNDRHLLVFDEHLRLTRGPTENGHRPAIDPLFRSVARAYGPRAVGVVLSGARDDGAAGLAGIAAHGGVAIVQEPAEALYPWMPQAALDRVRADHIVPAAKIGGLLAGITAMDLPESAGAQRDALLDTEVAMSGLAPVTTDEIGAAPAGFGCPSCGGSLFQIDETPVPRYRCRVGHAWSPESLLDEQAIALEEKSALSRRMSTSGLRRHSATGTRFRGMAEEAEAAGAAIRQLIAQIGSAAATGDTARPAARPGDPSPTVR